MWRSPNTSPALWVRKRSAGVGPRAAASPESICDRTPAIHGCRGCIHSVRTRYTGVCDRRGSVVITLKVNMERRDIDRRAELVRSVVTEIVQNPDAQVTILKVSGWLRVRLDVAERIVNCLVAAGVLHEIWPGVWSRSRV